MLEAECEDWPEEDGDAEDDPEYAREVFQAALDGMSEELAGCE